MEKIINEFYKNLGWHDSRGTKVKSWKHKIQAVWLTPDKIASAKPEQPKNRTPSF